jgi:hypothetical protein
MGPGDYTDSLAAAEAERRRLQQEQAEQGEARFQTLPGATFVDRSGRKREDTDIVGGAFQAAGMAAQPSVARFAPVPSGPQGDVQRESIGGPTEPGEADQFAGAGGELARRAAERQQQMLAAMQGGMGGGGYRPEELKLSDRLRQAYEEGLASTDEVAGELRKFQGSAERQRLMAEDVERQKRAVVDEQARATRLADIGRQQGDLTRDISKRMEEFKVDPNRLFGQGGERATANFALGLANVFSNVGEAMQGKAGTNAVLGLVRDRIAQDIALQENDYRRMLQGYEVKRNGLMDAIQMVGNERQGAEALARQQALAYAGQLGQLERGLKDAQARGVIAQARATILAQYGKDEQAIMAQNVAARNQATAQAASAAAADRRAIMQQRLSAIPGGVSQDEQKRVDAALDKAETKGLFVRVSGLKELRKVVEKYPNAAEEARGILGSFYNAVNEGKEQGTLERLLANAAQSQMSDGAREYIMAYNNYIGPRIRALAGANVTPGERFLYDPQKYSSPKSVDLMLANESKRVRDEAEALEKSSGLAPGSDARLFLRSSLYDIVGTSPKAPPKPQYADAQGRPLK